MVAEQLLAGSLAPLGRAAGYPLRRRAGGGAARHSADDRGQDGASREPLGNRRLIVVLCRYHM